MTNPPLPPIIGVMIIGDVSYVSSSNPNGWNPKYLNSAGGISGASVLEDFTTRVSAAKKAGAGGIIVWDGEGYGRQAIAYQGDMELGQLVVDGMKTQIANLLSSLIIKAGMQSGVCIRPTEVIQNAAGDWIQEDAHAGAMDAAIRKMKYANTTYGCTLCYIDSTSSEEFADLPNPPYNAFYRGSYPGSSINNFAGSLPNLPVPIVEMCQFDAGGYAAQWWDGSIPQPSFPFLAIAHWKLPANLIATAEALYASNKAVKLIAA